MIKATEHGVTIYLSVSTKNYDIRHQNGIALIIGNIRQWKMSHLGMSITGVRKAWVGIECS